MDIPHYPETRPLAFDDKPLFDGLFARLQPRISEFTFTNIFLFRAAHDYRITRIGEAFVLLGKGYAGEGYFLPPLGNGIREALVALFDRGLVLYGADDLFRTQYLDDPRLTIREDRDSFDYLYLRRDLAELPGSRYHKKKNRINYFTNRHVYQVQPYAEIHGEGCQRLLDVWLGVRQALASHSLLLEADACREALRLAPSLGLKGVVVVIEGEVKGFVFGERLNNETSVCHFEKTDPFVEGLSQLLDREFNRLLFTDCTYVNREQDLGEPGLREAKLSYHPAAMVRKYRVYAGGGG